MFSCCCRKANGFQKAHTEYQYTMPTEKEGSNISLQVERVTKYF